MSGAAVLGGWQGTIGKWKPAGYGAVGQLKNWGLNFLNRKNSKCKDSEVRNLLLKAGEENEYGWNVRGEF